ncbi:unnamed protein product [Thelazia callipaeda]|uniref:Ion_trans_2 domain-containing protein n=1 Tax=Thelazia callipaeda TaxID=103827 RepID=A0A0N5DAF8_THECL|nr:unnamed protein product [Thelazia callipaeda]
MFESIRWLQQIYQRFHLSHLLPFLILISYTLLGAAVFRRLELERDLRERELFRKSYYYAYDQITKRILELRCEDEVIKNDRTLQVKYAEEAITWFLTYLNFTTIIQERNDSSPWSWYGSMFYAGQLYTTIGYGLPVAKTLAGQIASIFYIMFGIPIFLIILKNVGRLMSRSFRKCYKRLRSTGKKSRESLKRVQRSMKTLFNHSYLPSSIGSLRSITENDIFDLDTEVGTLIHQKKNFAHENAFPIPIALAVLILWIGFSAALFCLYESEWGYLTSVYFFFVSISTVGLGDIVPGNKDMMLGYFLLILIGLALLSMCINLIQVALEKILGQLLQEYIDEIERVAAIAKTDSNFETKTSPFEVGMTGGLLSAPLATHQKKTQSIPSRIKAWIAERIADNIIESQLVESDSDAESKSDVSTPSALNLPKQQHHCNQDGTQILKSSEHHVQNFFTRLSKHIPAIRTVQALEKANFYTTNDDFHEPAKDCDGDYVFN